MSGQALAIATGGIVFCRKQLIRKNVIPIKFNIKHNKIALDIKNRREKNIVFKINKVETNFETKKLDISLDKPRKNILYKKS